MSLTLAPADGQRIGLTAGVDLIGVGRVRELLARPGFARAVFQPAEIAYCQTRPDPATHFAARFCAKEATLKAFGLGLGVPPAIDRLREAEVLRAGGAPGLRLHGRLAAEARRRGVSGCALSLSHTAALAIAQVQLTWGKR